MRDKIFLPSVIITLVLLIIFLLIGIINQTSVTKSLSDKVETLFKIIKEKQPVITLTQTESLPLKTEIQKTQIGYAGIRVEVIKIQSDLINLKAEFIKMQKESINLKEGLIKMQKEISKLKADFQSHSHRNKKLILIESVDKGK